MHGVFVKICVILMRRVATVVERYSRIECRSIILGVNSETIIIKATSLSRSTYECLTIESYLDAKEPLLLEYM